MNRRKFLSMLGVGAAMAVAAPILPKIIFPSPEPVVCTIGEYADYVNFSTLEIAQAIDEDVQRCASELAFRAGQSMDQMYRFHFDRVTV